MTPYPNVFRPIVLNGLEIRNRIVRAAHGTGLSAGGLRALIDYHDAECADWPQRVGQVQPD